MIFNKTLGETAKDSLLLRRGCAVALLMKSVRNRHPATAVRKGANRIISEVMGTGIVPLGYAGCRGADGKRSRQDACEPHAGCVRSNDACAPTASAPGFVRTKRADVVSALLVARLAMIE